MSASLLVAMPWPCPLPGTHSAVPAANGPCPSLAGFQENLLVLFVSHPFPSLFLGSNWPLAGRFAPGLVALWVPSALWAGSVTAVPILVPWGLSACLLCAQRPLAGPTALCCCSDLRPKARASHLLPHHLSRLRLPLTWVCPGSFLPPKVELFL